MPSDDRQYTIFDFVVVGAGSGGCVSAGRLSEDTSVSVALLEAGGRDDSWVVTTPAAFFLMVGSALNNWQFNTVPQRGLNGRLGYQPRGKGLGGSSAINAMVYIRAAADRVFTLSGDQLSNKSDLRLKDL